MMMRMLSSRIGANRLTDFVAVLARHHHIEQHQIGLFGGDGGQRRFAIRGGSHLETRLLHQELQGQDDIRFIVHHQNLVRHIHSPGRQVLAHRALC
jgi:hypothetical protein